MPQLQPNYILQAEGQAVTRPHIDAIRGVNCDITVQLVMLKSLLHKGLILESGRADSLFRHPRIFTALWVEFNSGNAAAGKGRRKWEDHVEMLKG